MDHYNFGDLFIIGEVSHLEREQIQDSIKPDFNLINDRVVPLELDPLGSPNDPDLVHCSSSALQSDNQQPDAQESPASLSKQGVNLNGVCSKVCLQAKQLIRVGTHDGTSPCD